ncbi:unnamed protein product [Moneuplotes crassus]|uniref:Uncharacterized protein n=1 Tax=Euplotes crassus TaxID=5936 RepID=A0AAD1XKX2_EUPCR|nr:unnamed protein product [Moneuplotes crassus]
MEERTFKAVVTDHTKVTVIDREFRDLRPREVLVKMHSMPINPNDRYIVSGFFSFGAKGEYKGVGFEGAGEVIDTGSEIDKKYIGKKVATLGNPFTVNYQGSWRQYLYCEFQDCAVYPDEADYDKMCSTFINPIACLAMLDFIKKKDAKCIVQDAACSSLGKMVCRQLTRLGIKVINIVRREEQVEIMMNEGAEYVLNSSAYDFDLDLNSYMRELKPAIYFAAVGGKLVEKVMFKMPPSSTVVLWGSLEDKDISFSPSVFIFSKLTITYLTMFEWLYNLTKEEKVKCLETIIQDICSDDSIYASNVLKTFSLDDVEEALKYSVEHASEGKVILKGFT